MSIAKTRVLAYLAILITGVISANLIKDIFRLWRADDRLALAEKELAAARQEEKGIKTDIEANNNQLVLEKEIRNVLKMARPNEVVVVIPEAIYQAAAVAEIEEKQEETSNFNRWLKVFGF